MRIFVKCVERTQSRTGDRTLDQKEALTRSVCLIKRAQTVWLWAKIFTSALKQAITMTIKAPKQKRPSKRSVFFPATISPSTISRKSLFKSTDRFIMKITISICLLLLIGIENVSGSSGPTVVAPNQQCTSCECRCRLESATTQAPRTQAVTTNAAMVTTGNGNGNSGPYPVGSGYCDKCSRDNLDLVNNYRVRSSLVAVQWNTRLAQQAAAHSKEMYDRRSMYHSNYGGWENVAYTYRSTDWPGSANYFFTAWQRSSGHNTNMLRPSHRCVGIAIHGDGTYLYATQIFSDQCN